MCKCLQMLDAKARSVFVRSWSLSEVVTFGTRGGSALKTIMDWAKQISQWFSCGLLVVQGLWRYDHLSPTGTPTLTRFNMKQGYGLPARRWACPCPQWPRQCHPGMYRVHERLPKNNTLLQLCFQHPHAVVFVCPAVVWVDFQVPSVCT